MPPQPRARRSLRSKTGCLTCRQQKKKCDEKTPSCSECLRYSRVCVWPTVFTDGRYGKRRSHSAGSSPSASSASPPSEPVTLPTSSVVRLPEGLQSPGMKTNEQHDPYQELAWYPACVAEGQERLLFHHFSTCTLSTAIRAHAHPVYAAYQDVYQFAFEMPDVMNVFLGIAALRIGQNSKNSVIRATQLYTPSVNAVRRMIKERKVNGTEEWLLVIIAFMVIFETSRYDISSSVMLHLGGLAQIFKVRKLRQRLPDPQRPFHRIAAEAFTYHLATYSVLYGNLESLAQQFTWADLDGYDDVEPCPQASHAANSPILGSPLYFELFRMIFEITRLSRHTPLSPSLELKAIKYKRMLDIIQQRLTQALNLEGEGEHESDEGALLYTLTTQLFLFKVMNPEVDTEDPTIRHISSQALLFVDMCRTNVACNSYFCWPLTILACAVRTEEGRESIERKMAECRRWIPSGQIFRTSSIIKAIWEDDSSVQMSTSSASIKTVPRGLDRLLHKNGLVDTLFLSGYTQPER